MDQVLFGLPYAWYYIDDMIIFNKTPQEHVRHLQIVFERLRLWIAFAPWQMQGPTLAQGS